MAHKTITASVYELDEKIEEWLERLPDEVGDGQTQYLLTQTTMLLERSRGTDQPNDRVVTVLCIARAIS